MTRRLLVIEETRTQSAAGFEIVNGYVVANWKIDGAGEDTESSPLSIGQDVSVVIDHNRVREVG